jgi:hypothetical protein
VDVDHVDRPDALLKFFEKSNNIDSHTQLHQGQLALEKCWVTQDCWFRLHATIIGIHTMYMFRMAAHHKLIPKGSYPMMEFALVLSHQLITHLKAIESHVVRQNLNSSLHFKSPNFGGSLADDTPSHALVMPTPSPIEAAQPLYSLIDQNGKEHHCVPFKKERDKNGKNHTK